MDSNIIVGKVDTFLIIAKIRFEKFKISILRKKINVNQMVIA